jgi:hypothetical protein
MIGCQPFGKEQIGFALPIFSHRTDAKKMAIQEVDEITGRVIGFTAIEQTDGSLIQSDGPSLVVGDEPIYAFMESVDSVHAGTLRFLRATLEKVVAESESRPDLILQIRELIGSAEEKKVARAKMQNSILQAHGTEAARSFYEGSVLRSAMWSCLLSTAHNEKMARRILSVRSSLSASIASTGGITFDLSALTPQDQNAIDQTKLLAKILLEFDPEPSARPTTILSDNYSPDVRRSTEVLLEQISHAKRQEERVAMLLSAILDNPIIGKSALLQYRSDRAKFADWAVKEISRLLLNTDWSSDERIIAALIPTFFTRHYPLSRADLLLALAKHLGKWPLVSEAIKGKLAKTRSIFIHLRRAEIEKELSRQVARETSIQTLP